MDPGKCLPLPPPPPNMDSGKFPPPTECIRAKLGLPPPQWMLARTPMPSIFGIASGTKYHSMSYGWMVPHNTISPLTPDVCQAIIAKYKDDVMKCHITPGEWRNISDKFMKRWNFLHRPLHVVHLMASTSTASVLQTVVPYRPNYNYKGLYSVVPMALVDADYKFIWAGIGGMGTASDSHAEI